MGLLVVYWKVRGVSVVVCFVNNTNNNTNHIQFVEVDLENRFNLLKVKSSIFALNPEKYSSISPFYWNWKPQLKFAVCPAFIEFFFVL